MGERASGGSPRGAAAAVSVVLMGVSGAGKTTIGRRLADALGMEFVDGDDFHDPASIARMRAGFALEDADRLPWLDRLNSEVAQRERQGRGVVLACSALRASYRERLLRETCARLIYLRGEPALIAARLATRRGHFMPADLLASQFAALEEPLGVLTVDVDAMPDDVVRTILHALTP